MADSKKNTTKYKFGQRELDMQDYLENIGYNVQSYLEDRRKNRGWTDDQVQEFSTAYNRLMNAYKQQLADGSNRFSTNDLGDIIDSQGEFSNIDNDDIDPVGSQYYYNDKGERITTDDYNLLKDKKKKKYKTFNANRQVAEYFRTIGNKMKDAPKKEAEKFDLTKHGFVSWWNHKFNPAGGEVNLKPFLDKDPVGADGKRAVSNRAKLAAGWMNEYLDWLKDKDLDYSNYDQFKDYDTYANQGRALAQKWNDNNWDADDLIAGQAFGISNDFSNGFFTQDEDPNLTQEDREKRASEQKAKEDAAKKEQEEKDWKSYVDQQVAAFANSSSPYTNENPYTVSMDVNHWYDENGNLNQENYFSSWGKSFLNNDGKINPQALTTYMNGFVQNPFDNKYRNDIARNIVGLVNQGLAQQITSGDMQGMYYIPSKSDEQYNRALVYDPNTHRMFYTFIGDIPSIWEARRQKYRVDNGLENANAKYYKEGGIVSMQLGGDFGTGFVQSRDNYVSDKAKAAGVDVKTYEARNRKPNGEQNALEQNNGFTGTDMLRLAAVGADITSVIASFTPGTIVSTGAGAVGTTSHLAADISEDGLDWGDVGRAALGYGLDALSLIPGVGAATRGARVLNTVAKFAPKIMLAIGGMHALSNGSAIMNSLKKVTSDEKLTVQDWQNIGEAITLVTGGGAAAGRHLRTKAELNAGRPVKTLAPGKYGIPTKTTITKPNTTLDRSVLQLRRKGTGEVENITLTKEESAAVAKAKNNEEIMAALKKRDGIDQYELATSTSMRPRFQWIRQNGKWQAPVRFDQKTAQPIPVRIDQVTGRPYVQNGNWGADLRTKRKLVGEVEEGTVKRELAPAARQSAAYERALAAKGERTTKFTQARDEVQGHVTNYAKEHNLNEGVDLRKLQQVQRDLATAEATWSAEHRKLNTLLRRSGIKPKTIREQRRKVKEAERTIKELNDQVSGHKSWQNLNSFRKKDRLQQYIDEIKGLNKQVERANKRLAALDNIKEDGHTPAYQQLLGRKTADGNIEFGSGTISRNFDDILAKYGIKYEEGGKFANLRKLQLGGSIKNVQGQADWFRDMFKHNSMQAWLGTWNAENYKQFNDLQDSWDVNLHATHYDPNNPAQAKGGENGLSQGVLDRQKLWNKTGTNQAIGDLRTLGILKGNGGTDDQSENYADGYFGAQEFLRHGGTSDSWYGHEKELKALQEKFKEQGLDYYLDTTNNMYKLRPLQNNTTTPEGETTINHEGDDGNETQEQPKNFDMVRTFLDPKYLSIANNMYANTVNDKMTDRAIDAARKSLTLYDPKNTTKYVQGDFDALMAGEEAAGRIMHMASQPVTSDGAVQTAAYMDSAIKAQDYIRQGRVANNQALKKSKDELWKLRYDDDAFNYDVAMKNRQSIADLGENIANLENARDAKKYANDTTLFQELLYPLKQKANKREALEEQFALSDIKNAVKYNLKEYAPNVTDEELEVWNQINSGDVQYSSLSDDKKKAYMRAAQKAADAEQNSMRSYYGINPGKFGASRQMAAATTTDDWYKSPKAEKGGTLTLKDGSKIAVAKIRERSRDADRFYKTTKDRHDRVDKAIARVDKKMYRRRDPEKRRK